jgi:cytochrome P450 family 144
MVDRLVGSQLVDDPYPFYEQLRQNAPVWRVPGTDAFLVSTWELVREATGRVEDFSNHFRHTLYSEDDGTLGVIDNGDGGVPDVFAGADPPEHTEHRKVFFSELVQARMARLEPDVATIADHLLDELLRGDRADAAAGLADILPLRIMAERVIGLRVADLDQMRRWVFAGSRFQGGCLRLDELAAVGGEVAGMWPWVAEQLNAALAAPVEGSCRRDVIGVAAAGVREGMLTEDEAAFTLMVLLGAGGETTTSLIGNAVRILAERPALQDQLRARPDLVPAFIEEVLRYESPFRFHPRTARGPVELGGLEIPDRAMVVLLWGSANRDPSVFERPEEFVLGRANARQHVGFGRGIHYCVGAPLARLESRVVITKLLERTRRWSIDPERPPSWVDSLWIRRHERLPIFIDGA